MTHKAIVENAARIVREQTVCQPAIGLILGSGLGDFAAQVKDAKRIPYQSIPGYPRTSVKGHVGEFVVGRVEDVCVILARGRFHWYEGHPIETISLPVQVFHAMGVQRLIVTNAAGSTRKEVFPGTMMLINRFIDATYQNGPNPKIYQGKPWVSEHWLEQAQHLAGDMNLSVTTGGYSWSTGPSYETPEEIHYLREYGTDAVGMSTLPEVLIAAELGLTSLAISALTNYAAGISQDPLTHDEVIETASKLKPGFEAWIKAIIKSTTSQ